MDTEKQGLRSDLTLRTAVEDRCSELESRYASMEAWKAATAAELEEAMRMLGEVEGKVGEYEVEKAAWGRREETYRYRISELEEDVRKKDAWGVKVMELKTVNQKLEVANVVAEEDVRAWKCRCEGLEMVVKCLEEEGLEMRRTLSRKDEEIRKLESERNNREELVPTKGMETSREGSVKVIEGVKSDVDGVVVIVDSEDEMDVVDGGYGCGGTREVCDVGNEGNVDEGVEDGDRVFREDPLVIPTPEKKRASRVVFSDSDDEDDNVPIEKLILKKIRDVNATHERNTGSPVNQSSRSCFTRNNGIVCESATPSKRRLVPLSQCQGANGGRKRTPSTFPVAENVSLQSSRRRVMYPITEEDDIYKDKDVEDATSESEGDSLGGFIVDDFVQSESRSIENDASGDDDRECTGARIDVSEESDSDPDMKKLLAQISREKKLSGWEYEADMLSSLSNDPELCMKAVCALYRLQTNEEKSLMLTMHLNGQGFNKLDATRASSIANFLLDGNPHGPLKRSVDELQKFDWGAISFCSRIACRYSKQLFSIYQNRKDPFFCPS